MTIKTTALATSTINAETGAMRLPNTATILRAVETAQAGCSVNLLDADDVTAFVAEVRRLRAEAKRKSVNDLGRVYVVARGGYACNTSRYPSDATTITLDGGGLTVTRETATSRAHGVGPTITGGIRGKGGGGIHGR